MADDRRVTILDFEPGKHLADLDLERARFGPGVDVRLVRRRTAAAVLPLVEDADVIIVWTRFPLDADVIGGLTRCRGIVCASVGYDHVDLAAAAARGITVCNVPDYGTEEVADHTLALLLSVWRRLPTLDRAVRHGRWDWRVAQPIHRLRGRRLGIVGLGRIGTAVALRARAFGLSIRFYDPYVPVGTEKALGLQRARSLDALLDASDILSLHAPSTPETRGLINGRALARLRPGAVLVNTARGDLVDLPALVESLERGHIGGAGLDVLADEPAVPRALIESPRVVLSPHAAWYAEQALADLRTTAVDYAARLLAGSPVPTALRP